ncbi:Acetyltransferase, GNAT family [Candidatus Rhodobacter oscarellae]|uniref:Acetyltransferase, GNAT family n=1 Tax=Candidatus Rhodobacter oscarellae TaxID=1675527 RepID=A0A0J9ECR4_9RHOB|nr:GNAT family N-acetyltransferase [Candidatus Rhodobacter lobularis]KMW60520.1 Acetyltransferase, GNAT family [Candidatus Rhodobacter lobularis]
MTNYPAISPIRTDRLTLRGLAARDLPGYVAYRQSPRSSVPTATMTAEAATEMFNAMVAQWTARGFGRYAITTDPEQPGFGHVGLLQASDEDEAEMTWTLWNESVSGQGYATEATRAILTELFAKGWQSIPAYIDRDNAASLKMAARLGAAEDTATPPPAHFSTARRFVLTPEGMS